MTDEEIVAAFGERLQECVHSIHRLFSEASRATFDGPVRLIPRDGGPVVRVGDLEGLGHFQVHGLGCAVELANGEIIDFNWDSDGREIFDGWRLRRFARSRGENRSEADLVGAARKLDWMIETKPGWFALVEESNSKRTPRRHSDKKLGGMRSIRPVWQT